MTTDIVASFPRPPLLFVGGEPRLALDPCSSDPKDSREALESSLLSERLLRLPDAAFEAGVAPTKKVVEFSKSNNRTTKKDIIIIKNVGHNWWQWVRGYEGLLHGLLYTLTLMLVQSVISEGGCSSTAFELLMVCAN